MNGIRRLAMLYVIGSALLWLVPLLVVTTVRPDEIGVRQSNFSGVAEKDIGPGWALRIPGAHKIIKLPRRFEYLDYTADDSGEHQQLQIRTKDNNIVFIDVSVPYRVKVDEGWRLVQAGNHQLDADGRYRFQRLATETTVSVLREELADLSSAEFYSTTDRLKVGDVTLAKLNGKLSELHLEAERVLVRAVQFREEYEQQLQQIQLNEQKKLLDEASERVAREQQTLDNYQQATNALAASLEQRWIERIARIERAYQVGLIDVGAQTAIGSARRQLEELSEEERKELVSRAAKALELEGADVLETLDDSYLMGIRNIQAETLEYEKRVKSEAEGISARLSAEGEAMLAKVRGEFEGRVNQLLNSSAGQAYVAWKSAENVTFDSDLVFRSVDGVPVVLRLRELTESFMGKR